MLQILQRWKITIHFDPQRNPVIIYMDDNFYSNILRKVADIHFEFEVNEIIVDRMKAPQP